MDLNQIDFRVHPFENYPLLELIRPAWKSKLFRENQVVLFGQGALHSLLSPLAFHTFTSLSST